MRVRVCPSEIRSEIDNPVGLLATVRSDPGRTDYCNPDSRAASKPVPALGAEPWH
jgi:hypothetical protein